jgi:PAS domain S-box-containing protein
MLSMSSAVQPTQDGSQVAPLPRAAGGSTQLRMRSQALPGDKIKGRKPASQGPKCSPKEQRLLDSEVRYRRLFEAAQDGIAILDPKTGTITEVNPYLIKLLDYPQTYFVGKALWEIGLFNDIEASKKMFRQLQTNKYVRYDDLPLRSRDGRAISVEFVSNVYGARASG